MTDRPELAGRLVTGLMSVTCENARYIRYTSPTLNGVKISKSLQTKLPPERVIKEIVNLALA